MKGDEWTEDAQRVASELSPKVKAMLSGRLKVEILPWVFSMEASFTLLLYDTQNPLTLVGILLMGCGLDVPPKRWDALSCLAALHKRGWLTVQGEEYGLNPEARWTIYEIAGKGDRYGRWSALHEWMRYHPAEPMAKD
ncbi:MAG TPA: hypothetical protein VKF15_00825 [Nitrososphaerales archaeon]|nr:hypothetical protein [Nitrososphaerales archaeon]